VVIILLLMALNLKVLLVAGSNKGIDNLAEAVVAALSKHTPLQRWCGQLVRFRTPAYQLAQVRIDSANSDQRRLGASRKGSLASQVLDPAVAAVPVLQQSEVCSRYTIIFHMLITCYAVDIPKSSHPQYHLDQKM
jgi:hypothetical protein